MQKFSEMTKFLFLFLILSLPLQFALSISENIDLVTTRVIVLVAFFIWIFRGLYQKRIWIANRAETWLVVSFLFLAAISLSGGLEWEKGIRKLLYLFSVFPIYFVGADLFRDKIFQLKAVRAIVLSGFLAASIGISQFFLPFFVGLDATLKVWKNIAPFFLGGSFAKLVTANPSWLVNISVETWMRAFGFFPDPHAFSFFVSLCLFVGLGYFAWEKDMKWKILAGTAAIFMFFAVIFSFSRGAYLGSITGGVFFLVILLIRAGNFGRIALTIAGLAFLALIFFQGTIQSRLTSALNIKEGSNAERIKNWQQAVGIVKDFPLTGVGLGNYSSHVDPLAGDRSSIYAHNIFLDVSAETGITNGIVFVILILASIWRSALRRDMISLGLAAGLVYFFVHGIFDTPIWSPPVLTIFLVIIALGIQCDPKAQKSNVKTAA